MSSPFPLGPDSAAQWENEAFGGEETYPQSLLLLPDAGNSRDTNAPAVYYYLPKLPSIARNAADEPIVSLTLILSRMPAAEDEALAPLIKRGQVAFTVDLSVSHETLARLIEKHCQAGHSDDTFQPLFARSILATLDDDKQPLITRSGSGSDARIALSASLDCVQTLTLLDALNSVPGSLRLLLDMSYRAVTAPKAKPRTGIGSAYTGTTVVEENPSTASLQTVTLEAPLNDLFGSVLDDGTAERYIRLIAVSEGDATPRDVPVRLRERSTKNRDNLERVAMVARRNDTVALATLLSPNSLTVNTTHLQLNQHQPELIKHPNVAYWQGHDYQIVLPPQGNRRESLPLITNENAPLWADYVTPSEFWYAPQFRLVPQDPTLDPKVSPYLFSFVSVGHNAAGVPGLEGTIQFTLSQSTSDATQSALNQGGNPTARPVTMLDLAVYFLLPFRDQNGTTRVERFIAEVTNAGNKLIATVRLMDDWVRLAYGALAIENYQAQPAQVLVSYCYRGYTSVPQRSLDLHLEARDLLIPVHRDDGDPPPPKPYFDPVNQIYLHPQADIKFMAETEVARPIANQVLAIRPELFNAQMPVFVGVQTIDTIQTFGVNQALDVVYPCAQFGAFYLDESKQPATMIGCANAFDLGQTRYRQFERMDDSDLQNDFYTIYRSLQQVGLFLIVPRRYCITRFAPDEGDRAFRPVIYLYSVMDSSTSLSRCDFGMTLEPDVPGYIERDLIAKLASRAANPTLTYPTEIEAQVSYAWSLVEASGVSVTPTALPSWNSFQVTLSTNLIGALQVQAMLQNLGISAEATFVLPDGSSLHSTLQIDLGSIVGPRPIGPLSITQEDSSIHLTNPIERAINVTDLALYPPGGTKQVVAVDQQIAPHASATVNLPATVGTGWELLPVYVVAPGDAATLAEIRSFIEDIRINIIIVNLIDLSSRALKALRIEAQFTAQTEIYTAEVNTANPSDEIKIVLPLTTYLAHPALQVRVGRVALDDSVIWTTLKPWSLETEGHIISLTWELLTAS